MKTEVRRPVNDHIHTFQRIGAIARATNEGPRNLVSEIHREKTINYSLYIIRRENLQTIVKTNLPKQQRINNDQKFISSR